MNFKEFPVYQNPPGQDWPTLCSRPVLPGRGLFEKVENILRDVQQHGDDSVKKYTKEFDRVELDSFAVNALEIEEAASLVSDDLKEAITLAAGNIRKFHATQLQQQVQAVQTMPGVTCWRRQIPIQKVGLYIPGGSAPLFSTLLMLAIPAQIAGCKEIILCTPANAEGKVHPAILYAAGLLGLHKLYKIGGVQAIAAMAYGTETVPAVYKIFGPGNQYVTAAKQVVSSQGVAIDMPAGPSELAVYADASAIPAYVAADLLSQAEHGADSQVVLVATDAELISKVQEQLLAQLLDLPRKDIATAALENSRFVVMSDPLEAFAFLNEYAPEHLIIASNEAAALANQVVNAGSVFLGNYAPESAGDYASGTNHTLPTNGYARAYSGVSTDSFTKQVTFQEISQEGLHNIGRAIECMAAAEGLQAHKNAVTIRLINDK